MELEVLRSRYTYPTEARHSQCNVSMAIGNNGYAYFVSQLTILLRRGFVAHKSNDWRNETVLQNLSVQIVFDGNWRYLSDMRSENMVILIRLLQLEWQPPSPFHEQYSFDGHVFCHTSCVTRHLYKSGRRLSRKPLRITAVAWGVFWFGNSSKQPRSVWSSAMSQKESW